MPERDGIKIVVREWVKKAEGDFKTASHVLKMGAECPTEIVCFHAQQCVEKYLKALLVLRQIDFPKIHDIARLALLVPKAERPLLSLEEQQRLTAYATISRYPGDYEPVTMKEARGAVSLARRIRSLVRKRLPGSTLKK